MPRAQAFKRAFASTFLRFLFIGGATALVYAAVLVGCVELGHWQPPVGAALAYVVGISFNYLAHYRWTYRTNRPHRSSGPRYLILVAALFAINVTAITILPSALGLSYGIIQVLVAIAIVTATFIFQSAWVFARFTVGSSR